MTFGEVLAIVGLLVAGGALWVGRQARIVYEELEHRRLTDAAAERPECEYPE